MTWVKLDDAFPSHPKVDALSDGAFRLHVTALCWSCQWLTDGVVPTDRLRSLPGYRYKASHVAELLAPRPPDGRAAWVEVDGGYRIHDFLDYQVPAAKVRADRAAAAERMRKHRTPDERTADVRPNTERTNGEVREKFADPVPVPGPVPHPEPEKKPSPPVVDLGGKNLVGGGHGAAQAPPADPGFEAFWNVYPRRNGRRVGRADAERAWKRLSKPQRHEAEMAVRNYAAECNAPDGPLAKDAHRWLTNGRWKDYLTTASTATNGHGKRNGSGPSSMDFFALADEMRAERIATDDDEAAWPEEAGA